MQINNPRFGRIFISTTTLNELRAVALNSIQEGYNALVSGGLQAGDGQGGIYTWNSTSTAPDDGARNIAPASNPATGRWVQTTAGLKGDPGSNTSDVGTFAQAKVANLANGNATTIRLSDRNKAVFERDTGQFGDLAASYSAAENIWWFRDAANTRWIVAGQQIDIMACGAVASKTVDNRVAIQAALDFGAISQRNVFVPAGTFNYTGTLAVRNKTGLIGIPGQSILYCSQRSTDQNTGYGAIIMEGSGGTLYGITRLHDMPRPITNADRQPADAGNGIYCRGARDFTISFCRTEGVQGGSLMLRGCQYGRITNNTFESSLADSIHVTAAAKNDVPLYNRDGSYYGSNEIPIPAYRLHIADNIVNNSGDDNIAVVSYVAHSLTESTSATAKSYPPATLAAGKSAINYPAYFTAYTESGGNRTYSALNQSINITGNSTYGGDARGIAIVGAKNVNVTGNYVEDPVVAGFLAYGEESYGTYGCENVLFAGNTLVNTGNDGSYRPIRYDANGDNMKVSGTTTNLTRNPTGAANAAIIVSGRSSTYPSNAINVTGNLLVGIRERGLFVGANVRNVDVTNNTFRSAQSTPLFIDSASNVRAQGNRFIDCVVSAINVNMPNLSGHIAILGNHFENVNTSQSAGTDVVHCEGTPSANLVSMTVSDNRVSGAQTYERFVEAFFDNIIAENNVGAGDVALGATPYSVKQRMKAANVPAIATSVNAPGTAPTALSDTVSRADYNALVTQTNALKNKINELLTSLSNAGIQR